MGILTISLYALGALFVIPFCWGYFLSVMHLKSARNAGKLTPASKVLGYPWLAVGYLVDVAFNAVVGTVIFLELPHELLFTARVSRLNDGDGRRAAIARWICRELLDPFDPAGHHCR